jgi:hypothetical protein
MKYSPPAEILEKAGEEFTHYAKQGDNITNKPEKVLRALKFLDRILFRQRVRTASFIRDLGIILANLVESAYVCKLTREQWIIVIKHVTSILHGFPGLLKLDAKARKGLSNAYADAAASAHGSLRLLQTTRSLQDLIGNEAVFASKQRLLSSAIEKRSSSSTWKTLSDTAIFLLSSEPHCGRLRESMTSTATIRAYLDGIMDMAPAMFAKGLPVNYAISLLSALFNVRYRPTTLRHKLIPFFAELLKRKLRVQQLCVASSQLLELELYSRESLCDIVEVLASKVEKKKQKWSTLSRYDRSELIYALSYLAQNMISDGRLVESQFELADRVLKMLTDLVILSSGDFSQTNISHLSRLGTLLEILSKKPGLHEWSRVSVTLDQNLPDRKRQAAPNLVTTNTQAKILDFLHEMGYLAHHEKLISDYHVDFFLAPDLIIEYCGPSHYYLGEEDRRSPHALLKTYRFRMDILKGLGYKVKIIPYHDWHYLESHHNRIVYLKKLINS